MSQDPASVLAAFVESMWNAHRLDRFDEFVHPDVRFHPPRGPSRDFAGYRRMSAEFLGAFSDLRFTIEHLSSSQDRAAARLTIEGTNDGPFRGLPPTGKRVRVVGQPQCRVAEGKIVEFWQLFDELGLLHQLGHVDARLLGTMTQPETA